MIKSAQSLWKRTIEVAKDNPPEYFLGYPHASDLRIGWYPSPFFFQPECVEDYFKALPDLMGAVFPYHTDYGTISHLVVATYQEDGTLHPKRRAILPNRSSKHSRLNRLSGVFGIHRLKNRHASLVLTDDELLVCKFPNVVAVSNYSPRVAQLIKRSTSVVNLKSDDPKWINAMYALAKHGIQVAVNDRPLVDHLADAIVGMLHDRLGLSIVTSRIRDLLSNLVPMERMLVIQLVKQATNVNLEDALPSDFKIYAKEADFYESVEAELKKLIRSAHLQDAGLWMELEFQNGRWFKVPFNKLALGAAVCQAAGVKLDLMDWAKRDLKEIPHFYLYRGKDVIEPRAGVCSHIADVVMTVLSRWAMASKE